MMINLLCGFTVMAFCLMLQSVLAVAALRYYAYRQTLIHQASFWLTMKVITSVMLILVAGNIAQVLIWALLYHFLGEFAVFGDAVYHSGVNFTTLGYGDIVMSEQHRLLGPLEAINGVLMIGVSTAALMAAFQDSIKKTLLARSRKPGSNS